MNPTLRCGRTQACPSIPYWQSWLVAPFTATHPETRARRCHDSPICRRQLWTNSPRQISSEDVLARVGNGCLPVVGGNDYDTPQRTSRVFARAEFPHEAFSPRIRRKVGRRPPAVGVWLLDTKAPEWCQEACLGRAMVAWDRTRTCRLEPGAAPISGPFLLDEYEAVLGGRVRRMRAGPMADVCGRTVLRVPDRWADARTWWSEQEAAGSPIRDGSHR